MSTVIGLMMATIFASSLNATQTMYVTDTGCADIMVCRAPFGASSPPLFSHGWTYVDTVAAYQSYVAAGSECVQHVDVFRQPLSATSAVYARIAVNDPCGTQGRTTFDRFGNLWVPAFNHEIFEYTPPFSSRSVPVRTLYTRYNIAALAFDTDNRLYATMYGPTPSEMDVFSPPTRRNQSHSIFRAVFSCTAWRHIAVRSSS